MKGRVCSARFMERIGPLFDKGLSDEEVADILCFSLKEVGRYRAAWEVRRTISSLGSQVPSFSEVQPLIWVEIAKAPEPRQLELVRAVIRHGLTTVETQKIAIKLRRRPHEELRHTIARVRHEIMKQTAYRKRIETKALEEISPKDITPTQQEIKKAKMKLLSEKARERKRLEQKKAQIIKAKKADLARQKAQSQLKPKEPGPLPEGVFNIIYADPPWDYEFSASDRGNPEKYYSTMPLEKICGKLPPEKCAKDSVLFLWATNPKLTEALELMKAWGFEYRTNMVWVKDKIGTGYYFRGRHELLLIGKKGEPPVPLEEDRPPSVLISPRGVHSEKPETVYEIIEKMFPTGKYLELFARGKRARWEAWGNEA